MIPIDIPHNPIGLRATITMLDADPLAGYRLVLGTFCIRQITVARFLLGPAGPTGCATRLKGENVALYSPGLASTHSIERRPLSTAQGCKDVTGSIIQRAKCHNARIHVAADRNTNMLDLNRKQFAGCGMTAQKHF